MPLILSDGFKVLNNLSTKIMSMWYWHSSDVKPEGFA